MSSYPYISRPILLGIAAIGLFCILAMPQVAYADGTIVVDTVADEFGAGTDCSLREAIQSANTDSDFGGCTRTDTLPYTLELMAGEYTLSLPGGSEDANATGDLDISTSLTIAGAGAGDTIIQAGALPMAAIDRVIHILPGATVTIAAVTLRNGATPIDGNGGGIANMGGTLTLVNSIVRDNIALGDGPGEGGGGIFNAVDSRLTLSETHVLNNSAIIALGNGGGILTAPGSTLVINGGQIENNRAARAGGGVENNGGNATFTNIALDGNTTGLNGGGLHISGAGIVTMTGGTAAENSAGKEGGALWNAGPGQLIVDDVTIEGNTASGDDADQGGGGLFSDGGKLIVRNSVINNNRANGVSGSGGGILVVPGSALTVTNSTLSENTAMRAGGGLEVAATVTKTVTARLENLVLRENQTGSNPGNGGALHITGPGTVTVTGSNITGNTASAEGGGLWNSASGTLTVDKSTLRDNMATGAAADHGGGGLYNDGGALTVSNSTISGNSTQATGGGILNVAGTTAVINVTLYENSAANGASGLNSAAGTTTIANSIVAHDAALGADCVGVTANSTNLDSDGTCQASIMADPKLGPLQLNGGTTPTHELLADSPAINAGDNASCAAAPINNLDQRGQARPFGATCDLGAYERAGIISLIRLFFPFTATP